MTYKKSKYNLWIPYKNDKIIVYNTLSASIGVLDRSTFEHYQLNSLSNDEKKTLYEHGILVEFEKDEMALINESRINSINRSDYKNIRVWTTTLCNANCPYCFEKNIPFSQMTLATANASVKYIQDSLQKGDKVEICWFGGEPLMNASIIDFMTYEIKEICRRNDFGYRFSIISNGSLITEEIIKKFISEWSIDFIQITLDGFGEEYNKIKKYNSSCYDFFQVVNNVKAMAKAGIHISIRMNYNTTNYESLKELILYLKNELRDYTNINYYVYPVWQPKHCMLEECGDITKVDSKLLDLYDILVENRMTTMRKIARLGFRKGQCMACNKFSYSILPDGNLVKCCESYSHVIGNVYNGITESAEYKKWTFEGIDTECENCVLLPMCQGGCRAGYFGVMDKCIVTKNILPETLKWYVGRREKTKE